MQIDVAPSREWLEHELRLKSARVKQLEEELYDLRKTYDHVLMRKIYYKRAYESNRKILVDLSALIGKGLK